jgi:hypothetical protein
MSGPPRPKLVTVRVADVAPSAPAVIVLVPTARPVTRPMKLPVPAGTKSALTSRVPTATLTFGAFEGTSIRTRTSPSLTRSARVDSVVIVTCAESPSLPPQAASMAAVTAVRHSRGARRPRVVFKSVSPWNAGRRSRPVRIGPV